MTPFCGDIIRQKSPNLPHYSTSSHIYGDLCAVTCFVAVVFNTINPNDI